MNYKIPLFDLNFDEKEEQAALNAIRSRWISTGPKTAEFESIFSEQLGVKYSLALANCTVALHLALRILDISADDEVIVPSLTFVATANAVRYVNAVPVFCDVKSYEEPVMDPALLEKLITPKTKAIIVMHYGGFPCDMEAIMKIAGKYNLRVIEDACHAPLSEDKSGKKMGTIGDIGCFSFFSNKNISTGEGGMLVTNNEELFKNAKLLRSHGMTTVSYDRAKGHCTSYEVFVLGFNYGMDDIRSAIGVEQMKKLRPDLEKRAGIRKYYVEKLQKLEGIVIPFAEHTDFVSNYIFPIILKDSTPEYRDNIRTELQDAGIQTSVHYPAVHRFAIYANSGASLPLTEYIADNEITLPMYANLTKQQIDYIVEKLGDALGKK